MALSRKDDLLRAPFVTRLRRSVEGHLHVIAIFRRTPESDRFCRYSVATAVSHHGNCCVRMRTRELTRAKTRTAERSFVMTRSDTDSLPAR
jgi:hypothetical protein